MRPLPRNLSISPIGEKWVTIISIYYWHRRPVFVLPALFNPFIPHARKQTFCCECFQTPASFCKSSDFQVQRVPAPLSLPVLNTGQHLSKHALTPTTVLQCGGNETLLLAVVPHRELGIAWVSKLSSLLTVTKVIVNALIHQDVLVKKGDFFLHSVSSWMAHELLAS